MDVMMANTASLIEQRDALMAGRVTSRQLVEQALSRIDRLDRAGPMLGAIAAIAVNVLQQGDQRDAERARGELRGPLHGLPLLIKDNILTWDIPTTAGSVLLSGWQPERDADCAGRLRSAGAIMLAKTNMHEFAFGMAGFGSAFGQVRNFHDPSRTAGGSSSGTGAGIAAGYAAGGLGTDTCGSIAIPSAFNGIVGLRPTQGIISREGIVPLSSTQDTAGPMGRCVADVALLLDVLMPGQKASDTSRPFRVGYLLERFNLEPRDEAVCTAAHSAIAMLDEAGLDTVEIDIPGLQPLIDDPLAGSFVLVNDVAADLDEFFASVADAPLSGFADIAASPLIHEGLRGNLALASGAAGRGGPEYQVYRQRRALLADALVAAMDAADVDALCYPTVRCSPPTIGEPVRGINSHLAANSGLPALTVPSGLLDGLPVGIDFLGRPYGEARLLALGQAVEQIWGDYAQPVYPLA